MALWDFDELCESQLYVLTPSASRRATTLNSTACQYYYSQQLIRYQQQEQQQEQQHPESSNSDDMDISSGCCSSSSSDDDEEAERRKEDDEKVSQKAFRREQREMKRHMWWRHEITPTTGKTTTTTKGPPTADTATANSGNSVSRYHRLTIINSGSVGTEISALRVARRYTQRTGGYAASSFHDGQKYNLMLRDVYGLEAHSVLRTPARRQLNMVMRSDATIVFWPTNDAKKSKYVKRLTGYCRKSPKLSRKKRHAYASRYSQYWYRPLLWITTRGPKRKSTRKIATKIRNFIVQYNVRVVYITGLTMQNGIGDFVTHCLDAALLPWKKIRERPSYSSSDDNDDDADASSSDSSQSSDGSASS